jgi:hypothetical protein
MKQLLLFSLLFSFFSPGQAQSLDYYLPKNVTYNSAIPTPKSVIYHEVGEWHVTHDRLVNYMKAVDAASDRITLQVTGFTYEGRPQLALIITSPENQKNIEQIRQQHLALTDPSKSATINVDNMPDVVWMGYSIHGNESSGANASLLAVYYLAAAQGPAIDELLKNTVILIDPSFNPDGLNRFATWANMHKSATPVTDPAAREFNEVWPGGRFNHYWFDLNRDWLPAQHVESKNRLAFYHQWMPNIFTDHHEMGSNSSFFFQPGVPSRANPNTPKLNQELTGKIGNYHAKYLDSIGSLYFTKEGYDDFYYGKGSTYPDINGGIGILFEQASSRGHAQETENGLLTFPFTIRNQFTTTLSTLEAAKNLRKELLTYQKNFYSDVQKEAAASAIKGYVFGDAWDKSRTYHLVDILLRHGIDVYEAKSTITAEGKTFAPATSFIVPTNQPQYKVIKTIFEKTLEYKDSLFYDVTAWTFPLAFNLPYAAITTPTVAMQGDKVLTATRPTGNIKGGSSSYAYLFSWDDYYAPKLLYQLQKGGLGVKVATQKLEALTAEGVKKFDYGTILINVKGQTKTPEEVYKIINDAVAGTGVVVYSIASGLSSGGIDLGSASFNTVKLPKVMMFGGTGTSATDVGEIWHLLDQKFNVPVSIVDVERFGSVAADKYNVIIMPSGSYNNLDKNAQDKLRSWVSSGGTLIATEDAVRWLSNAGFTKVTFKYADRDKNDTASMEPYYLRSDNVRAREMTGSIFEAKMDLTHPICYGYKLPTVSVFKANNMFMDGNNSPYDTPVMYTADPLQSGYIYRGYKNVIKNSAVINIDVLGRGKIISMVDNLNLRAFWYGTSKLFMNSIFFGDIIRL